MISVEDLTKRYGDVLAVDRVSFRVESGEVLGLLGPNGAGKSTTIRCLVGFLMPDAGRIEVGGARVDPADPRTRSSIGYLPETTPLYPRMRVVDYLDFVARVRGLAPGERRSALERVLEDCDLRGWESRRIAALSRGYRQRVGLAQALIGDPQVLVLDEPTSGLDPAEVARIRSLVRELARAKTILISTHVLSEVQELCARVIILAAGRVVADGSTVALAEQESVEVVVCLGGVRSADEPLRRLGALPGVRAARLCGVDGARVRISLEVEERFTTSARVAEELARSPWTLHELRHELPSLERVFLARIEPRVSSGEGA